VELEENSIRYQLRTRVIPVVSSLCRVVEGLGSNPMVSLGGKGQGKNMNYQNPRRGIICIWKKEKTLY
jgi:hypothetical protein